MYLVTRDRPRDSRSGVTNARYRALVRSWVRCTDERALFVVYDGFRYGRSKPFFRAPKGGLPVIGVGTRWLRAAGIPSEALADKDEVKS